MTQEEAKQCKELRHTFIRIILFGTNPFVNQNERFEIGNYYVFVDRIWDNDEEDELEEGEIKVSGIFLYDVNEITNWVVVKNEIITLQKKDIRIIKSSKEIFEDMLKQKQENLMEKLGNIE